MCEDIKKSTCPLCNKEIEIEGTVCPECAFASLKAQQLSTILACTKEDLEESNLLFDYSIDEIGAVINKYLGTESEVYIPSSIAGKTTYKIGYDAFKECKKIIKVVLPDTITIIEQGAFCWSNLETIVLSKELRTIGNSAFSGTKLKHIDLPDSVDEIGTSAFSSTPLTFITIPEKVKIINACTFYDSKLETVILKGVEKIQDRAFAYCKKLKNLFLPETLQYVGDAVFEYTGLKAIIFPKCVTHIGSKNYPLNSHIAILNDDLYLSIGRFTSNLKFILYCNRNSKAKISASEIGIKCKPLSDFPKD